MLSIDETELWAYPHLVFEVRVLSVVVAVAAAVAVALTLWLWLWLSLLYDANVAAVGVWCLVCCLCCSDCCVCCCLRFLCCYAAAAIPVVGPVATRRWTWMSDKEWGGMWMNIDKPFSHRC